MFLITFKKKQNELKKLEMRTFFRHEMEEKQFEENYNGHDENIGGYMKKYIELISSVVSKEFSKELKCKRIKIVK